MKFNIKSKKNSVQNQSTEKQSNWLLEAEIVSDIKADRINGGARYGFIDRDPVGYPDGRG
jgi:hypothetical protein